MTETVEVIAGRARALLNSLLTTKERIQGNHILFARQLCEEVEALFMPFFNKLMDPIYRSEKISSFGGLRAALDATVTLLEEIAEFMTLVADDSSIMNFTRDMLTNNLFRTEKTKQIASFYERLHQTIVLLDPTVVIDDVSKDKEQFQLHICSMLGDIFRSIQENNTMYVSLFADMRNENKDQQKKILENLDGLAGLFEGMALEQRGMFDSFSQRLRNELDVRFGLIIEAILGENEKRAVTISKDEERRLRQEKLDELKLNSADLCVTEVGLGQGGFGMVYIGYWKGNEVAVKRVCDPKAKQKRSVSFPEVENELLVMKYLAAHPSILPCYGYTKSESCMQIVLELAPFGSLSDVLYMHEDIEDIPMALSMAWMCDISNALSYIHSKKVKHRDIKGDNFLVFHMFRIKLCDFGLAKEHHSYKSSSKSTTSQGTLAFMAPEVRMAKGSTYASDIFSFAMTAIQILSRKSPHASKSCIAQVESVSEETNHPLLKGLLLDCIQEEPVNRPQASEVHRRCFSILHKLGGDPRMIGNEGYDIILALNTVISEICRNERTQDNSKSKSSNTASTSASSNTSVSPDKALPVVTKIDIACLNQDEAVQFLIKLGCQKDLHEKVAALGEDIDGECLKGIQSVTILQQLEGNQSAIRALKLNVVLQKLQEASRNGIPRSDLDDIKIKVAQRQEIPTPPAAVLPTPPPAVVLPAAVLAPTPPAAANAPPTVIAPTALPRNHQPAPTPPRASNRIPPNPSRDRGGAPATTPIPRAVPRFGQIEVVKNRADMENHRFLTEAKFLRVYIYNDSTETLTYRSCNVLAGSMVVEFRGNLIEPGKGCGFVFQQCDTLFNNRGPEARLTFTKGRSTFEIYVQQNYCLLEAGNITCRCDYQHNKYPGQYSQRSGKIDIKIV